MSLADLAPLLRSDAGLTHAFGDQQAVVAVGESAFQKSSTCRS